MVLQLMQKIYLKIVFSLSLSIYVNFFRIFKCLKNYRNLQVKLKATIAIKLRETINTASLCSDQMSEVLNHPTQSFK